MTTPNHESHHETTPRFPDVSITDGASLYAPPEIVAHNSNHMADGQNEDVPSEWLTGNDLIAVSIAFGIADMMVALESSILGIIRLSTLHFSLPENNLTIMLLL
ncbi:hypothetical protein BOTNAR_0586g00030 [Botryotinia narcissicola]|uniref:Uncharacterized protein n=1 Tax=Botryotinia narcissicola TaxID=278944 RepID=A0A4Z1HI81_9HELO|nr:hypothetical protein BOTNAR_0586g00030 [Botryotinia narcissicola]